LIPALTRAVRCLVLSLICVGSSASALAQAPTTANANLPSHARLHAFFEAYWEAQMREYPEWATYSGDHRYGDRLTNASAAAKAARYATARDRLKQAKAFEREPLNPVDRVSLSLFIEDLESDLRGEPLVGLNSLSLGAQGGFQSSFAGLMQTVPMETEMQAEQLLRRLASYPTRVDQEIASLRQGLALRWVPPREVLQRVLAQLDDQLTKTPPDSPYFEAFKRLGKDIPADKQSVLKARALELVSQQVVPALQRLRAFAADEYLAAAPASGAMARYPEGDKAYAHVVKAHTTTDLTPAQIHAIGLREMARLRAEIEVVMKEAKFEGDFNAFITFLNTDPRFFYTSPEALLAGYRDISKRLDPELPRLFATLPRAPYGVRAMPTHYGADASEYYDGPAQDGSRPGWFNANALAYKKRPTWGMETLVAHEAVPGHHLQTARAAELGELPKFRREAFFTAYVEGWAVYAETLGADLGLYKDPYSRFGHLQWQAFRAGRLVVDTGLHALGWSRQQAIDYLVDNTGEDAAYVASEVDRYISWPGQALAYMIGKLKIDELRDRARAQLGPRFDIRQFHNAVLDQGAVSLKVLELTTDQWIAQVKASRP
jgi:uncharacterized protein (DUF885 family)